MEVLLNCPEDKKGKSNTGRSRVLTLVATESDLRRRTSWRTWTARSRGTWCLEIMQLLTVKKAWELHSIKHSVLRLISRSSCRGREVQNKRGDRHRWECTRQAPKTSSANQGRWRTQTLNTKMTASPMAISFTNLYKISQLEVINKRRKMVWTI